MAAALSGSRPGSARAGSARPGSRLSGSSTLSGGGRSITSTVLAREPESTLPTGSRWHSSFNITGCWAEGLCEGLGSTQNPQVQLQPLRRSYLSCELQTSTLKGEILEITVLGNSRWGARRFDMAHTLLIVRSTPCEALDWGGIRFEFEANAGEVLTLLLTRSSSKLSKVGGCASARTAAAKAKRDSTTPSATKGGRKALAEAEAAGSPCFLLTVLSSHSLEHGPTLLKQRAPRQELEEKEPGRRNSMEQLISGSSMCPTPTAGNEAAPTIVPKGAARIRTAAQVASHWARHGPEAFRFVRERDLLQGAELEDFEALLLEMTQHIVSHKHQVDEGQPPLLRNLDRHIEDNTWKMSESICWSARIHMDREIREAFPAHGGMERNPKAQAAGLRRGRTVVDALSARARPPPTRLEDRR